MDILNRHNKGLFSQKGHRHGKRKKESNNPMPKSQGQRGVNRGLSFGGGAQNKIDGKKKIKVFVCRNDGQEPSVRIHHRTLLHGSLPTNYFQGSMSQMLAQIYELQNTNV